MDKYKKSNQGSLTVEAALIMPIVIMSIFSLLYLAFYAHDLVKIHVVIDKVINRSSLIIKQEADIITGNINYEAINDRGVFYPMIGDTKEEEKSIEKYLLSELEAGLFITNISEAYVEAKKQSITIKVKANINISIPKIKILFPSTVEIRKKGLVHNPAEFIRIASVAIETGSKIKGADEIIDKLSKIINLVH